MLRLSIYDVQHCPIGLRPIISQVYSACYPTSLTFHYAHACHTLVTNHSHCTTVVIKYSAIRSNQLSDVGNRLGVHQRRKFVTKASALGVKIPIFNVDNVVTKATTSEQARIRRWTGPCGGKWLYLCMVIRSCVLAVIVLSIFLSLAIKMPTNSCFGMYGTIIQNSCEGLACVTSIMLVFIFVQYSLWSTHAKNFDQSQCMTYQKVVREVKRNLWQNHWLQSHDTIIHASFLKAPTSIIFTKLLWGSGPASCKWCFCNIIGVVVNTWNLQQFSC